MKSKLIYKCLALIFLVASVSILNSCKKKEETSPSGSPGTNEVWMQSNAFNPSSITVVVNTTITWTNKDGVNHTVTSNSGSELSSGTMGGGATFSHKFTATGTFPYHCTFHSGMNGTVVVN